VIAESSSNRFTGLTAAELVSQWDAFAEPYARWFPQLAPAAADALLKIAPGTVLELGSGHGRVCTPLAERGRTVVAIDFSPRMVKTLSDVVSGGSTAGIDARLGNIASVAEVVPSLKYGMALALSNTLAVLPSLEEQQQCLHSLATVLPSGGLLVIEVNAPTLLEIEAGFAVRVSRPGRQVVECFRQQPIGASHVTRNLVIEIIDDVRHWSLTHCYLPIHILDDIVDSAGFTLVSRWQDLLRNVHDGGDWRHVSVWARR
jgi:SAM-dependent methyltransferase